MLSFFVEGAFSPSRDLFPLESGFFFFFFETELISQGTVFPEASLPLKTGKPLKNPFLPIPQLPSYSIREKPPREPS